jgi:hypothetical protein
MSGLFGAKSGFEEQPVYIKSGFGPFRMVTGGFLDDEGRAD